MSLEPNSPFKKLFVWDFHGTLEQGNDLAVHEITNRVLAENGYDRRMSIPEAEMLSGRRWREYFTHLLPEADQEIGVDLCNQCLSISSKHPEIVLKYIQLVPSALAVLEAIEKSHHTQIVLSNTQTSALDQFLAAVSIERFFPAKHRFAADTHRQNKQDKRTLLSEFLKDKHFPAGLIAIGDSPGDVSLADCHPKGVGYLYAHPGRTHRPAECKNKIHDLSLLLEEI